MTYSELTLQLELNRVLGQSGQLLSDPLCEKLTEIEPDPILPPLIVQEAIWEKVQPDVERVNKRLPTLHQYQCDIQAPTQLSEQFSFSHAQIRVIAEGLGNEIKHLRNDLSKSEKMMREQKQKENFISLGKKESMGSIMISVIIPNYNYSQYIHQCIQSVIDSEFDLEKIEIIVVDDASTDDSVEIIRDILQGINVSTQLIQNDTNLGLIRSRNRGIVNSYGEFLFFLDADNYIGKDCLRKHYETISQNSDISACYGVVQEFLSKTNEHLLQRSNQPFDYQKLLGGNYIDAMAMFRKSDLVEIGMYDTKMPPYCWEDYELWLRLGNRSKNVAFIDGDALSYYRLHNSNLSSNISILDYKMLIQYLKIEHELTFDEFYVERGELICCPDKTEKETLQELVGFVQVVSKQQKVRFQNIESQNAALIRKVENLEIMNQNQHIIEQQKAENAKLIEDINKLKSVNTHLQQQAEQFKLELTELTASWSWRITVPLRKIGIKKVRQYFQFLKHKQRIIQSGFFLEAYYLSNNDDVKQAGVNPLKHYFFQGGFEGRNPGPDFESAFYLNQNPDVNQSGTNPLLHYILYGKEEGRAIKSMNSNT